MCPAPTATIRTRRNSRCDANSDPQGAHTLPTSWALRAGSGCAQVRHKRRFDFDHVFASDAPQAIPTSALKGLIDGTLLYFTGKKHSPALWVLPACPRCSRGVWVPPHSRGPLFRKAVRCVQAAVFAQLAEVVGGVADGFDVAIFAYGQVCTTVFAG